MSEPAASAHSQPDLHFEPDLGLVYSIADRLVPFFTGFGRDESFALRAALSTIAAYRPAQRMDYADIARHVAFSLSSLTALGHAETPGLPEATQLRYLGKANTLSRSAEQAQRALTQRAVNGRPSRAPANSSTAASNAAKPTPAPTPSTPSDAVLLGIVDDAVRQCQDAIAADAVSPAQPDMPTQPAPLAQPAPNVSSQSTPPQPRSVAKAAPATPIDPPFPIPHDPSAPPFAIAQASKRMLQESMRKALLRQTALQQLDNGPSPLDPAIWEAVERPKQRATSSK
jgi:hypothetical protein